MSDTAVLVEPPASRRPGARAIAIAALALAALFAALAPLVPVAVTSAILAAHLALGAVAARSSTRGANRPQHADPAASLAVLLAAVSVASSIAFPLLWFPWQLAMAAALVAWTLIARWDPRLGAAPSWRARGRLPIAETAVVAGVTPFALVGWLLVAQPDLRDVLGSHVPDLPIWVLAIGAVGFSILNAAGEELIWRGVIQDRLTLLFGVSGAIALQAISFGIQHSHGIPRGIAGVLLAGTWGAMLGLLRHRSRGLLAPFVAHVVADAVIAVIVLAIVRST